MVDCCLEKKVVITEQTFKNGTTHLRKSCQGCDKFLGYKQKEGDVQTMKLHFGKHKGKLIKEIPRDYLSWLVKQDGVKDNVKKVAKKVIQAGLK